MSVWRRLQRVGKKAAKFEFTFSLQECIIECGKQYSPGNIVVIWSRRSRRHCSKPFKCCQSEENVCVYTHLWEVPDNMVFTTTLYRGEKAIQFEEKVWTCQLEDVGGTGTSAVSDAKSLGGVGSRSRLFTGSVRRRVLATRQIDLSEFASDVPIQQTLKVSLRLATKHITMANVTVTVNSVIVKEGEATDEDMISVASMMSMSRVGSFNVGSGLTINDVGAFSPPTLPRFASGRFGRVSSSLASASGSIGNFHSGLNEVNARLEKLGCFPVAETNMGKIGGASADIFDSNKFKSGAATSSASSARDYRPYAVSTSTVSLSNSGDCVVGVGKLSRFNARPLTTESSRDLLGWCQDVTKTYPGIHLTNLTTSFQSGLAFCAILHRFFPDKIQYPSQPNKTKPLENCRLAFEVAGKLGIARVLDPSEITSPNRPPDLLSMMTYLHQMRTRCCSTETTDDSCGTPVGNSNPLKPDGEPGSQPVNLAMTTDTAGPLQTAVLSGSRNDSVATRNGIGDKYLKSIQSRSETASAQDPPTNNTPCDAKNTTKNNDSRTHKQSMRYDHMLAKAQFMLQETREKKLDNTPFTDALPPLAQQRSVPRPQSTLVESPSNGTHTDSSVVGDGAVEHHGSDADYHSDASTKNQHVSTRTSCSPGAQSSSPIATSTSTADRQSEHRSASRSPSDKNSTSGKLTAAADTGGDVRVRRLRVSELNLFAKGSGSGAPMPIRIGEHHLGNQVSRDKAMKYNGPPCTKRLDGENAFQDLTDPVHSPGSAAPSAKPNAGGRQVHDMLQPPSSTADYISNEQAELDRMGQELDEEACGVEQRLRLLMARNPGSATEEQLLRRWFVLVNKKNAIVRRGMQLSIMEKEENLQKKVRMLQDELREMSKIEEYLKTDVDKKREESLLRDLVQLVNKRDDLIQELDLHEQGLAEDLRLGMTAEQAISLSRSGKGCILQ